MFVFHNQLQSLSKFYEYSPLESQEYGTGSEDDYDGDELEIDNDYKVPAPDVIRRCVEYAEKYENEEERRSCLWTFRLLVEKLLRKKVKSAGAPKTEQQKRKQHGQESKEEKREPKDIYCMQATVKKGRREAWRAKKEIKELYRCKAQRTQKVATISCPSSIRLM
ncbi:hypothetical protein WN944_019395 [Citrus x changshan-huyou]|uniref:Uncharacterized protein n=1 Tax=Citrus x changshan-huyou TaxID=2935761 RepID=A0AAP0LW46_9ROSI